MLHQSQYDLLLMIINFDLDGFSNERVTFRWVKQKEYEEKRIRKKMTIAPRMDEKKRENS